MKVNDKIYTTLAKIDKGVKIYKIVTSVKYLTGDWTIFCKIVDPPSNSHRCYTLMFYTAQSGKTQLFCQTLNAVNKDVAGKRRELQHI